MHQRAVLAGGCFWGMQDLIRKQPGIVSTRVGYTGGDLPNATYRNHGTHAEGIEITFDPEMTSTGTSWSTFSRFTIPLRRIAKETIGGFPTGRASTTSMKSRSESPKTRLPT